MKKLIVLLLCVSLGAATQVTAKTKKKTHSKTTTSETQTKEEGAKFKFKDGDTYDFGNIPSGPDVSHDFSFTNVGNQPLIIQDANPSCSCTTPVWPKQPVLPGKTAAVKVGFHTNHPGPFTKQVSILSNSITGNKDKRVLIYIKGNVTGEAKESTPEKKS